MRTQIIFNYPYFNSTLQGLAELIGNGSSKNLLKVRVIQGIGKGHTTEIPIDWIQDVGEVILN